MTTKTKSSQTPTFSIVCPCFNHEKYVSDFINSVLEQTYEDFELIIIDDCSEDDSVKIIKSFNDKRIKLIQHEYNKGINAVINTGFENSQGEYIVLIASDDMLEPFALQTYKDTFEKQPVDAIYVNLSVIDENSQLNHNFKNASLTILENEQQHTLLHRMFFGNNALYSPGLTLSHKAMKIIYPLPSSNSIYQDYKMNIEICGTSKIIILQDRLVKYRIVNDGKSLSSKTTITKIRSELEDNSVMDSFLKIKDIGLLNKIFEKEILDVGIKPYKETIKFFLGYMALLSNRYSRQLWGYHKIMEFYNENLQTNILKEKYNFVFKDLLQLTKYFSQPYVKLKLSFWEHLFSLKNLPDKKHKQLCVLGWKIRMKRRNFY